MTAAFSIINRPVHERSEELMNWYKDALRLGSPLPN
jgi:hypothetical protein